MDTHDLKNLFDSPSGTALDATTVLQHAERSRRRRVRVTALGIAAVTTMVVGVGALVVVDRVSRPGPDVLATPVPTVSAEPTPEPTEAPPVTPTAESTSAPAPGVVEPEPPVAYPQVRCEIGVPESWRQLLEAAPESKRNQELLPLERGGFVRLTTSQVVWERPGEEPLTIHEGAIRYPSLAGDGRFVAFGVGGGGILVWDAASPEQAARDIGGEVTWDVASLDISEGQLWFAAIEEPEDHDPLNGHTTFHHADLTAGGALTRVGRFENTLPGPVIGGMAQLTSRSEAARFLSPDGTITPIETATQEAGVIARTGDVRLLGSTREGFAPGWLWSPHWDSTFPISGVSGMAGDLVAESPNLLINIRTGVSVRFGDDEMVRLSGEGGAARLDVEEGFGDGARSRTIALRDLPAAQCS
ncbi:hypothetical protein [Arachnia propionica]|uniref:Uncharacterized protein n=1 Tax=Arachnia propionica TaxID=1750 RepID=A0A3P1WPT4_9ACTN|nr:hypothetical protein [Arachnia propionica]RRD48602.1 hypothetical protein EII35_12165 [Arachnia propionica]